MAETRMVCRHPRKCLTLKEHKAKVLGDQAAYERGAGQMAADYQPGTHRVVPEGDVNRHHG